MSDSFGAMGVLLTMVTILFTLWYPDIEKNLNLDIGTKRGNKVIISDIKNLYNFKLRVLLYGVLAIALVILPDIAMIVYKIIQLYKSEGINIIRYYKSTYPMYFLLWIFSLVLFKHIYSMTRLIKDKINKLEGK